MILYGDTSALVKLFLDEIGSPEIAAAVGAAADVSCAAIGYVELRAALAMAFRLRRLSRPEFDNAKGVLDAFWNGVLEVHLDTPLLRQAGDLAEQHALRGYDAVHLAALVRAGTPAAVTFACWDTDLRRAAAALGYPLFPVSP